MEKPLLKPQYISLSISFIFYLKFELECARRPSSGRPWTFSFAQLAPWIFKLGTLPQAGAQSLAVHNKAGTGDFKKRGIGERGWREGAWEMTQKFPLWLFGEQLGSDPSRRSNTCISLLLSVSLLIFCLIFMFFRKQTSLLMSLAHGITGLWLQAVTVGSTGPQRRIFSEQFELDCFLFFWLHIQVTSWCFECQTADKELQMSQLTLHETFSQAGL